ncbi:MAG TPA: ribonuclease D, partial [Thermoanaerobaculia bacterium]
MKWINKQADFDSLVTALKNESVLALDTEADSLHSYFDKVCLIQVSTPHADFLIDPLARLDLSGLGPVLGDRAVTKIFHGADYDLRILNRDFGFTIANLVDTMICAQLAGYEAVGLAALLRKHFAIELDKSHQRANWAMRPLPRDMLQYAATDTHHLVELSAIMRSELIALGRWEWAFEEFSRLEAVRWREVEREDEGFRRIKGCSKLDPRNLAILRRLYDWRDGKARAADSPPFKIIGNEALLEIARTIPRTDEALAKVAGVSRYHFGKYGPQLLALVEEALTVPDEELPARVQGKPWNRDRGLESRIDRLKKTRDGIASELKIDRAIIAPKHVLTAIATLQPKSVAELDEIAAMREWQKRLAGEAFVRALVK